MSVYDEDPDTGATRDASAVYPLVTDDEITRYRKQATAERYATLDSPSADYIAGYRAADEYPLTALRRYPDPASDYQRGHNANISERMRA